MKAYRVGVFISHSWSYSGHYDKLAEWIFEKKWYVSKVPIEHIDFSVPKNDPIHNAPTDKQLQDAIYGKIRNSDVIVIPTGMYASHSKWIKKEIHGSSYYNKPILAVNPWGQERSSSVVRDAANETVGWNSSSVVKGIWNLYRGEF